MNIYKRIDELTHAGLLRKQQSITRLFPDFGKKVKGIGDMGGLRLRQMNADTWNFKVHSGTKAGVWYDNNLRWKDLSQQLATHVKDARLWTKDGEHVDLRKLSKTLLAKADVQVFCSCEAFKYWGPNYILNLAKYDANAGPGENRPPNQRNPKQYGAVCKHLQNTLNVLPWYLTTMAGWLKDFYTEEIYALETQLKREQTGFKKAAGELSKRKEDEPIEEPEEDPVLPTEEEPEQELKAPRRKKVKKPKEDEESIVDCVINEKITFSKPKFDGMFYELAVKVPNEVERPAIYLKYRGKYNESDFHISIPDKLQGKGLAGEIIKAAVEQLSAKFGTLVISKGRIINQNLVKVIQKLESDKSLDVLYNDEFDRWEFYPKSITEEEFRNGRHM